MASYEYMKEYIATHPKYKAWREQYMAKYIKEYREKNRIELNKKRREYMARIRINNK